MPVTPKEIELTLKEAFPQMSFLEISDTSSGCGASYALIIVNPTFEGKMILARHRWVNEILREQISNMHAFSQKTYTPAEWVRIKAKLEEEEAAKAASATEP